MEVGDGLELRRAEAEDTAEVCALIGAVFPDNAKADPGILTWQYRDNPFGPPSAWVVTDGAAIVAHYAAFSLPARVAGEAATVLKSADAATLPAYRGRGLFPAMVRAVTADARERGLPVTLYSPANPSSARPLLREGMLPIARVPVHVAPLDDGWLAGRFHLPRVAAGVLRRTVFRGAATATASSPPSSPPSNPISNPTGGAEEVDGVPEGLDGLWATTSQQMDSGVVHDAAWWRWRFVARPGGRYRLFEHRDAAGALTAACAVSVKDAFGGRFVYVLDLQAISPEAARAVLAAAGAAVEGASGIAAIALPGSRLARIVTSAGLRRLPRRLEPNPFTFGVLPSELSRGDLADRDWTLSWCDLDHV